MSIPMVPADLRRAVRETESEVTAERWHSCACWDSMTCDALEHAEARARATAARLRALRVVSDFAAEVLGPLRRSDAEALARYSLAPLRVGAMTDPVLDDDIDIVALMTEPDEVMPAWMRATPETPAVPHAASPMARRLVLTSATNIDVRAVHWLWADRIARGTLALLAGREGLGKSTVAYWLAARVTRGELPGELEGQPSDVIIVATEDSREHTIVPRLIAAGADLSRVHFADIESAGLHLGLDLPRDLAALERAARAHEAALLVLDPLMSRLSASLDTHKDGDVRRALEPLVAIADRCDLSMLGLIHHNKAATSDPLTAVMGSKAFAAVARSVHTVVIDPDDDSEQRRLFGTVKNNLGRGDLSTLSFTIVGHEVPTSDGETATTGRLVWGDDHAGSIRDAIARSSDDADTRTMTAEAADWLLDRLSMHGGIERSSDVKNAARAAGFSERTIARARARMNVDVRSEGFPRVTWWSLPGSQIAPSGDSSRGDME